MIWNGYVNFREKMFRNFSCAQTVLMSKWPSIRRQTQNKLWSTKKIYVGVFCENRAVFYFSNGWVRFIKEPRTPSERTYNLALSIHVEGKSYFVYAFLNIYYATNEVL